MVPIREQRNPDRMVPIWKQSGQLNLQLSKPDKETSRVFTDTRGVEEISVVPAPVEVEDWARRPPHTHEPPTTGRGPCP